VWTTQREFHASERMIRSAYSISEGLMNSSPKASYRRPDGTEGTKTKVVSEERRLGRNNMQKRQAGSSATAAGRAKPPPTAHPTLDCWTRSRRPLSAVKALVPRKTWGSEEAVKSSAGSARRRGTILRTS
jgi:hypothetical protein